jgi:H+/Cl- antiporter ClcA
MAPLLHLPFSMLAAIGFVAGFAGAANTPVVTIVMAVELFGPAIGPLAAIPCIASYLVGPHRHLSRTARRPQQAPPGLARRPSDRGHRPVPPQAGQ